MEDLLVSMYIAKCITKLNVEIGNGWAIVYSSLMFFSKRDQVLVEIVNLLFDVVEKVSLSVYMHTHT